MKKNHKIYYLIGVIIVLVLTLIYQYFDYKFHYSILNNIDFIPRDFRGIEKKYQTGVSPQWKYIKIEHIDGERFLKHIHEQK